MRSILTLSPVGSKGSTSMGRLLLHRCLAAYCCGFVSCLPVKACCKVLLIHKLQLPPRMMLSVSKEANSQKPIR